MPLLLRSAPVDLIYTETLFAAGQEALTQGATESAYSLLAASEQLGAVSGAWQTERSEMFELELTLVGCVRSQTTGRPRTPMLSLTSARSTF
jgi:hypothetical protein